MLLQGVYRHGQSTLPQRDMRTDKHWLIWSRLVYIWITLWIRSHEQSGKRATNVIRHSLSNSKYIKIDSPVVREVNRKSFTCEIPPLKYELTDSYNIKFNWCHDFPWFVTFGCWNICTQNNQSWTVAPVLIGELWVFFLRNDQCKP